MDDHSLSTNRRRALREDVVISRAGREAARPLAQQLMTWQQVATRIGAKIEYARSKKRKADEYRSEVDQLMAQVTAALEGWRASLAEDDASGHVADAERSARTLLDLLMSLRQRT